MADSSDTDSDRFRSFVRQVSRDLGPHDAVIGIVHLFVRSCGTAAPGDTDADAPVGEKEIVGRLLGDLLPLVYESQNEDPPPLNKDVVDVFHHICRCGLCREYVGQLSEGAYGTLKKPNYAAF